MRAARPGAYEYEVKAAIEAVHRGRGAVSWAYPSIVGSGPNATILHYPESERQMQAGRSAARRCRVQLPVHVAGHHPHVSGERHIHVRPERHLRHRPRGAGRRDEGGARRAGRCSAIHNRTVEVIKAGLLRLGLITDTAGDQYKMWYTHGAIPLHRHRRARCRRADAAAAAGHDFRHRAWHLRPAERARRPAATR